MAVKVLIVEDDAAVRSLLADMLEMTGLYEVRTARDGEEGLGAARSQRPRIVVLDVRLPAMDGLELCRILKSDPVTAHAKIVVLTALDPGAVQEEAIESGSDFFITKPFDSSSLLDALAELAPIA